MLFAILATGCSTLQDFASCGRSPDGLPRPAVVPVKRDHGHHGLLSEIEQESFEDSTEFDGESESVVDLAIVIPIDHPSLARTATSLALARLITHPPLFLELGHFRC